jgi:GT2 family glycosyltransferase/glycosyltransferase involved in cell wall biosynthesis
MNKIYGMLRVRNESHIINDTLDYMSCFCTTGIFVYDDCSEDNTAELCENHFGVKKVIKGKYWDNNRERAEYENRAILLNEVKKYARKNEWIIYQDADERIEFDWSKLNNLDNDIVAIKMKLFDFYITPEDENKNYFDRKWIGPEYRKIIMAFRNTDEIKYEMPDQREVIIGKGKILEDGFVKHYGKAISVEEWEKTCEYYSKYFPKYAEKWRKRKGKAVHYGFSDFGNPLITWEEKEEKGIDLQKMESNAEINLVGKKLKILISSHHLENYQGTELYTLLLARKLKKLGHEVFVYSRYIGKLRNEFDESLIPIVENIEALKNHKFDIAHVHHNINALEVRNSFKDLPIVFVSHGIIPFLEQPPAIELGISKYIAISEEVFDNLVSCGVDKNNIVIIRNPIDEDYFYPQSLINQVPKNALIISNKIDKQRIETIKSACEKLDINLKIIGGSYGNLKTEKVREYINNSDIVFTLGRGVLESIFCERVVIIFDYQGGDGIVTEDNFEELMSCNFSGRKYRIEYDVESLTNEIKKFNQVDVKKVKEKALKYFSSKVVVDKLLDVYNQCINTPIKNDKINFCLIDNFVKSIKEVDYYSSKRLLTNNSVNKNKSFNKIKIGFLATDYTSACPTIRVISVLNELNKLGLLDFIPLFDLQDRKQNVNSITDLLNVNLLRNLDIVIVQREFCTLLSIDELRNLLHGTNVKIVYEIDDNLVNLYPSHPLFALYRDKKDLFIQYLSKSDLVTVTTPSLKNSFKHFSDKIAILPNYIDEEIWKIDIEKNNNDKVRILFSGSKTHRKDLEEIEDAIINIYKEFNQNIELIFWGNVTAKIEKHCSITKIDKHFQSYSEYADFLCSLNIDIGLIPLKYNQFNLCKSNIKWLDYSMAEIASILTDIEPYNTTVINQVNGLLVKNNPRSWYEAIMDLIINPDKRKTIAKNAHEYVKNNFTIQKNVMKWHDVYSSLIRLSSQSNKIIVSIITPTYNNVEYSKQFYESILESKLKNYELLIVDNGSTDSTNEFLDKIAKENKNVRLILNKNNAGFPVAINQGILSANGKYILIANNDIVLTKGCIERLIQIADSDSHIGIVGPISNEVSGLQKDKNAKYTSIEEMHKYAAEVQQKNKDEILHFPRVAFLCTLIKREVIEKIGGLDERFSPGNYEDDDFCLRAQLAGYKTVIAKDVFIHHYGSKSFKANGEKAYAERLMKNQKIFVEKWGATPDEIWLQNKTIRPHQIFYPIDEDKFLQFFKRVKVHLADNEIQLAQDSIEQAINFYSEGSAKIISKTSLLNLAGNLFLASNDFDKAQYYFEQELQHSPSSSSACFGLGQVFYAKEQFDAARVMFEWAVKNDPNNSQAVTALNNVNDILGLKESVQSEVN